MVNISPQRATRKERYSSPMASLVLTDISQLTSDSQHLGIFFLVDNWTRVLGFRAAFPKMLSEDHRKDDMRTVGIPGPPRVSMFHRASIYHFVRNDLNPYASEQIMPLPPGLEMDKTRPVDVWKQKWLNGLIRHCVTLVLDWSHDGEIGAEILVRSI
uniref:Uncharacterized protein n=1 Tax=Timema douglasi TaxID=61478 RepID=A0A7R8Z6I3_TIMDO|nr:unnamed protein product [Timema douglasi]